MYPKAMIFLAIVGVSLSLLLGLSSVVTWQIVAVLVAVSIGIPSLILKVVEPKEEIGEQEIVPEEKDVMREETIRIPPRNGYSYEFELKRGEHLKGEISSDNP